MKKILIISATLLFTGCFSGPIIESSNHNAVIPLGNEDVGIFIPADWEKLKLPGASDNVVLLASKTTQNFAISLENGAQTTTGESICNGAANGFNPFEVIAISDTECRFRGRVSTNTPMREFWQKIVKTPKSKTFLLASCSQETRFSDMGDCEDMIYSFGILDKK